MHVLEMYVAWDVVSRYVFYFEAASVTPTFYYLLHLADNLGMT